MVGFQRRFDRRLGRRRIFLERRLGETHLGGDIVGASFERRLERLEGLAAVVLLEKQFSPGGVDHRIVGRQHVRVAEKAVGVLEAAECARGKTEPHQI